MQSVYMWKSLAGKIPKIKIMVVPEGRSPNYGPCGYNIFIMKKIKGEGIELRCATVADTTTAFW